MYNKIYTNVITRTAKILLLIKQLSHVIVSPPYSPVPRYLFPSITHPTLDPYEK